MMDAVLLDSNAPRRPASSSRWALAAAIAILASLVTATATAEDAGPGDAADPVLDSGEELTVGVRVVAPFVLEAPDGGYAGITIELWEHIAEELGLSYRYEERDLEGLIEGLSDGSLDVSASALTITSEREDRVDFSHPFYVTGLGIAVPEGRPGLLRALSGFLSASFLWIIVLLAGLLLFWGVLVWIFERVENADEFGGSTARGIGSGFWWAAVTMTTVGYGDKTPRTPGGRAVGMIWMFSALLVTSFFTASIASSLTVRQLGGPVSGPADLPQADVGALAGAASVEFLAEERVDARSYETLEDGLDAVAEGEIDAFVHDAPILRYLARENRGRQLRVLDNTFAEQYYGIALPLGSELRQHLNGALLEYLARDEWERLQASYLGVSP